MADLVVIVVNYNSSSQVNSLLKSLENTCVSRVVIYDNASDPADRRNLASVLSSPLRVDTIWGEENIGFGAGVNRAISAISHLPADYYWILNPDVVVEKRAPESLMAALNDVDLVSPMISTGDISAPTMWFGGGELDGRSVRSVHRSFGVAKSEIPARDTDGALDSTFLTGAALMLRRSTWVQLGGFDESYFLYWEDADLSQRALALGLRLATCANAWVWHEVGASGESGAKSANYYYYMSRNRILFARAFYGRVPVGFRFLAESARLLGRPLKEKHGRLRKFGYSLRGFCDGVRGVRGVRGARIGTGAALFYKSLRSAHIERASARPGLRVYFLERTYDLTDEMAKSSQFASQVKRRSLARRVWVDGCRVLEINEPAMVRAAPEILAAVATKSLLALFGRRIDLVSYAIENHDPALTISHHFHLPVRISRIVVRCWLAVICRFYSRIAFGTSQSMTLYNRVYPRLGKRVEVRRFTAFPAARAEVGDRPTKLGQLVFVGALDERKGIELLLDAWPLVAAGVPGAKFYIFGVGPLERRVASWVEGRADVELSTRATRAEIFDCMAESSVVALLSQRVPYWREQIGLPLLEGISVGCTVVCTSESGIADELAAIGHRVIAPGDSVAVAPTVINALRNPLPRGEVLASLPKLDGRESAGNWLLRAAEARR